MNLLNYIDRRQAMRAIRLRKLRERFPGHKFEPVQASSLAYAFRTLIEVTTPEGRKAYLQAPSRKRQK